MKAVPDRTFKYQAQKNLKRCRLDETESEKLSSEDDYLPHPMKRSKIVSPVPLKVRHKAQNVWVRPASYLKPRSSKPADTKAKSTVQHKGSPGPVLGNEKPDEKVTVLKEVSGDAEGDDILEEEDDSDKVACLQCNKKMHRSILVAHLDTVHVKCTECDFHLKDKEEYLQHRREVHHAQTSSSVGPTVTVNNPKVNLNASREKKTRCKYCGFMRKGMDQHLITQHLCTECMTHVPKLNIHAMKEHFFCEICANISGSYDELLAHSEKEHVPDNIDPDCVCPVCANVFDEFPSVTDHILEAHPELYIKLYPEDDSGKEKLRGRDEDNREAFVQCTKAQVDPATSPCHQLMPWNEDEKRYLWGNELAMFYPCSFYERRFDEEVELKKHEIKAHRVELLSFKCPKVHCGNQSRNVARTRQHALIHRKTKLFSCWVCPHWGAKSRSAFNEHYDNIHVMGGQGWKCLKCGVLASAKKNIVQHLSSHHGIGSYNCSSCPAKFSYSSGLGRHRLATGHQ